MPFMNRELPARYVVLVHSQLFYMWRSRQEGEMRLGMSVISSEIPEEDKVQLLVRAGCRVRYYDEEGKEWVEESLEDGVRVVSGSRDGTWGVPSLEQFEKEYLGNER